ncbi:threonine synthase [Thalassobaculum fulvum]|uniref:Threonine synthase n=1 Tax=Thalassobaculum fulvum TaxID=1633335 RepID=A0A919CQV6_9PROT|nr:threonine synthase [Thalassobaculum fulvum]GHD57044.1 threonine synthase [Thalassobaculum fulvum]
MQYISTRGRAPALPFDEVLLSGLARDGGLYVPAVWPLFSRDDIRAMKGLSYAEVALRVMQPFVGTTVPADALRGMVEEAYGGFGHSCVAPLKQMAPNLWLMELFHGPTLAFKDYAMQVLGRLFDHVLSARGERVTIVGATSGDTGAAAIEACRDRDNIDCFILFPKGRVSPMQQRQMTTVDAPNVHAIAVEGTFDDCQDLVKAAFNDAGFRDAYGLSAVNSINWARIMPQIAYYFWAAVNLGAPERAVSFAVPTGNFGNVYAGYAALQMGLPVERLVVASNANDILARFFASGTMEMRGVVPTLSPSMDIQVSSNFERLLFDLFDRNGAEVEATLTAFRKDGRFAVGDNQLGRATALFQAGRIDDDEAVATIRRVRDETGELLDPHTATGIGVVERTRALRDPAVPVVTLATAHPAKFAAAIERAVGAPAALPERMADLMDRPERMPVIPNDLAALQAYVKDHAVARGAAA